MYTIIATWKDSAGNDHHTKFNSPRAEDLMDGTLEKIARETVSRWFEHETVDYLEGSLKIYDPNATLH